MADFQTRSQKRIIVVLGMHRSGTSVVTRALQVMGVDLGDHLMPGLPHNNPKGFWEDLDLNRINIQLMRCLSCGWDALEPLSSEVLLDEKLVPLKARAIELMREKTKNAGIFGMKDPRLARLMPFWKEVFEVCGLAPSYVIMVRNPRSVSDSLRTCYKFEREKAYYLWLAHVLPSILETEGTLGVVVDYDRLVVRPETEIRRLARALRLDGAIDPGEMEVFKNEFLEEKMRHACHSAEALVSDPTVPSLVPPVFEKLEKLASDEISFDDTGVKDFFETVETRFRELAPALRYMSQQDAREVCSHRRMDEFRDRIAAFERSVVERDKRILELGRSVDERDVRIGQLQQDILEKENRIARLERGVDEGNRQIAAVKSEIQEVYSSLTWRFMRWSTRLLSWNLGGDILRPHKRLGLTPENEQEILRSSLFLPKWYLSKYPDIAGAKLDPWQHYLLWGGFEGRFPSPKFDSAWYLEKYPEVLQMKMNPLVHYFLIGRNEGYEISPSSNLFNDTSGVVCDVVPRSSFLFCGPRRERFWNAWKEAAFPLAFMLRRGITTFQQKRNRLGELWDYDPGGASPEVSILIPTYGEVLNVEKCLRSMLEFPPVNPYEILIINDQPAKETVLREWISAHRDLLACFRSRILTSSQNIGFVASINALSKRAKGEYVFLLNDDTEISSPQWLDVLVTALKRDKGVGAAGGLLLYTRSNLVNHAGLFPVIRKDGKIWNGCYYKYFHRDYPDVSLPREVPMLTGAALLMPRRLFEAIGRLDGAYMGAGGFDDSDLSNRLVEKGYKLCYVPESVIYHHEGKTNKRLSSHRRQLDMNQRHYIRRWAAFLIGKYKLKP